MDSLTSEGRIDLILKTIENSEDIGFNKLHEKTKIPKKTLSKYLKELKKEGTVTEEPTGKNRGVKYYVNFDEGTKTAIKQNLAQISKPDLSFYETKYRKTNAFPHFLQELAAEFYQNMMSYLFWSTASYKYGVKRIEEILETEKKKLDKQFKGKSRAKLWNDCQTVHTELSFNASDSLYHAEMRNDYRTEDEIIIDCIHLRPLEMGTQEDRLKKLRAQGVFGNFTVGKYRADYIKDKKTKKLFLELADEYDRLSSRLSTIKYRLSGIVHGPPWEPNSKNLKEFGNMFDDL